VTTPGLITTPFTASSTAAEVLEGHDLSGLRTVVTGASSGLGAESARALVAAGAEVTLAVRDPRAGAAAARAIARSAGTPAPPVAVLDLADRRSVARFVDSWAGPLHLLLANAGVVTGGMERTSEGWELQFATNHLGHFALATGLHRALAQGAAGRGEARIVAVSSTAHMRADQIAYAQSKTANSLFAVGATQRWARDGIVANSANPGGVATGLQRNFTQRQKESLVAAEAAGIFTYKTVEQGAATSMVAAVARQLAGSGGHYLDDCQEAYPVPNDADLADHPHGVKAWALDRDRADRLWSVSTALLQA
jgi:NAD(P)-dependent dehydrogenase (short-subunit alcohol dehydrogenase family)